MPKPLVTIALETLLISAPVTGVLRLGEESRDKAVHLLSETFDVESCRGPHPTDGAVSLSRTADRYFFDLGSVGHKQEKAYNASCV